jgi:hypothetical protein
VPFIRPEFFVGARLTWGPVCKSGYTKYLVEGGLDLRFLGTTISTCVDTIAGPHEISESQNNCAATATRSADWLQTLPALSFEGTTLRR